MTEADEVKYLRALPIGYSVTVKDFGKEAGDWFFKLSHLRNISGKKIQDNCDNMVVFFETKITSDKHTIDKTKFAIMIPYEFLNCETIRVIKKLENDIYTS